MIPDLQTFDKGNSSAPVPIITLATAPNIFTEANSMQSRKLSCQFTQGMKTGEQTLLLQPAALHLHKHRTDLDILWQPESWPPQQPRRGSVSPILCGYHK
jgi:hypothetical protein